MEDLNLSSNEIENVSYLDELSKLKVLDISYNQIAEIEGLQCLAGNSDLRNLCVRGNPFVVDHHKYELEINEILPQLTIIDDQELEK